MVYDWLSVTTDKRLNITDSDKSNLLQRVVHHLVLERMPMVCPSIPLLLQEELVDSFVRSSAGWVTLLAPCHIPDVRTRGRKRLVRWRSVINVLVVFAEC